MLSEGDVMKDRTKRVGILVQDIRRRWRRRALIQGAALSLLTFLFWATVLLLLYVLTDISPTVLLAGTVVAAVILLGVITWTLILPAFKHLSDRQIALYVEEKIPELEDRLNAAIEIENEAVTQREHNVLLDRLIDDAGYRTRTIPISTIVDRKKERILTYATGAFFILFLAIGYTSLDDLRLTAASLDLATITAPVRPMMHISPGDVEIEKGESQEVVVELRKETQHDVVLHYRIGESSWQRTVMQKAVNEPAFLHAFLDIQEPIQYYAEYDEHRSGQHTISLYEFPKVAQIDLTYHFPSYTRLAPVTEENMGDIRGLKGSTVKVSVQTTGTVEKASLQLGDGKTVSLEPAGNGVFAGTIRLDEPGEYFVDLEDRAGKHNKFPEEYRIEPVEDEPPLISITDPNRDVRTNAIEEVLVAAQVTDDYGVQFARLKYSVNGEEEQTLPLVPTSEEEVQTDVQGEHLFFLEDFDLEPGDVISYYVEAGDYFHNESPEATDMYFIEVIPFDQRFTQVNNMGSSMQGAQASAIVLNQQQIIAATWKLYRERDRMAASEFEEAHRGLVQAQANLKNEIERRINATAFSVELQMSQESREIVASLRKAIEEMDNALEELTRTRLQEALTPERRALNHLLKADAMNKEQQVAMGRQQGGGGGSAATEERMTELMDLELDISKDKYEMEQQRQQPSTEREVDEALQKIRDLARKQQNLVNQGERGELKGEDKKRFIDRLKRDQDELARQSESLSQNMRQLARGNEQISRQMQERMERVSENMKQAEQALRRGDTQEAMARQQQALNELNRLQQQLRLANTDNTRELLDHLTDNLDQFVEQERQLEQEIRNAMDQANARNGRLDPERLEQLRQKRQGLQDQLSGIQEQLEALEERARNDDTELAGAVRNLNRRLRQEDLEGALQDSEEALRRGWLDHASRIEDDIQESLEHMEAERRALDDQLPVTQEEQIARALEDVREMMRQMQQMQSQSGQSGSEQSESGQSQSEQSQSGQSQSGQSAENSSQSDSPEGQTSTQSGQGSDRASRASAARMQQRLQNARETLERLQQDLEGNPSASPLLRGLHNALARADHTGERVTGDAADDLFGEDVYDALSQLEMELIRQLDSIEMDKKLFGARRADVPPQYREILEKYYEALAKTKER